MGHPLLELFVIVLLLLVNAILVTAETALIAARRTRLQQWARSGDTQAALAAELAAHPNDFLAAVQIGITLVGILAGAFSGATLAQEIAARFKAIPLIARYADGLGVGLVVLTVTYLSLVVGELVPKRLALAQAERWACRLAPPMHFLSRAMAPLVRGLSRSTEMVMAGMGFQPPGEPEITPDEIRGLIAQGAATGALNARAEPMLESVLQLDKTRIGQLMTPRTHLVWLELTDSAPVIREKITHSPHSRFVVSQSGPDTILGLVRAKDLLDQSLSGQALELSNLIRPVVFLPETLAALQALEAFKRQGVDVAMVTDEYGAVRGLLTPHDILAAIAGQLAPPAPGPAPTVRPEADGSWRVDGLLPIDDFKRYFAIDRLPDETADRYQTVGGFVLARLGHIPQVGETLDWAAYHLTVLAMDGRRVDQVRLVQTGPKSTAS